jgi:hypothetical protein
VAASGAKAASPARLVSLFSAPAHAPAAAALPTRRGALPCPACAGAHGLRGPADADALMRHRYGAAWRARGRGGGLRPEEAPPAPHAALVAARAAAARALRALGMRV